MYTHYTRKILDDTIDVLLKFEQNNIRPETLIAHSIYKELTEILQLLINAIYETHPNEARIVEKCLSQLIARKEPKGVLLNAYILGEIIGVISVLDDIYAESPKIFISHSSADKEIINAFVEKILILGCGFEKDDIFCTLNSDAIDLGADFRKSIINNMHNCDYIFLMISDNYRKSEICHNEVGAAWALQDTKRVIPLKFPNLSFSQEDLGVLNVVKQAGSINNKQQMTKIYDELCQMYDIRQDLPNYIQCLDDFVEIVNKLY